MKHYRMPVPRSRWHPSGLLEITWTEQEYGWVVGLLEGEGTFGAFSPGRGSSVKEARVVCSMTDEDTITTLSLLLPGKCTPQELPHYRKGQKTQWRTSCRGVNGQALGKFIYPVMSKRRQAQINTMLASAGARGAAA